MEENQLSNPLGLPSDTEQLHPIHSFVNEMIKEYF